MIQFDAKTKEIDVIWVRLTEYDYYNQSSWPYWLLDNLLMINKRWHVNKYDHTELIEINDILVYNEKIEEIKVFTVKEFKQFYSFDESMITLEDLYIPINFDDNSFI